MAAKGGQGGPNSRPADESHDEIDLACGIDLRSKLTTDVRLAWSVSEERRVEERDERSFDGFGRAVGASGDDGAQNRLFEDGGFFEEGRGVELLGKGRDQRAG